MRKIKIITLEGLTGFIDMKLVDRKNDKIAREGERMKRIEKFREKYPRLGLVFKSLYWSRKTHQNFSGTYKILREEK